ncbi:hypothetical protein H0H87_001997 [Tephrocybe sp. NHM501043]|nr:hypothetical protein H0H87_001997 [Tephrocybe sp. NHM501043]
MDFLSLVPPDAYNDDVDDTFSKCFPPNPATDSDHKDGNPAVEIDREQIKAPVNPVPDPLPNPGPAPLPRAAHPPLPPHQPSTCLHVPVIPNAGYYEAIHHQN